MAAPSPIGARRALARPQATRGNVAPLVVFGAALVLYLATLTRVHTFDALSYITSVERKPWTGVLFPHHLAYGPLSHVAAAFAQALGYGAGAALPMQIVSALAGAVGVAVLFADLQRVTRRNDLACLGALLLGGAYGYWYFALEADVY